jgi:hypothetical protein
MMKEPSPVMDLSTGTFDAVVYDPKQFVMVEFYAPWYMHHCI